MTAVERATKVAVRLLADYRERGGDGSRILSEGGIAHMIAIAIHDAVVADRAKCAEKFLEIARGSNGSAIDEAQAEAYSYCAKLIEARVNP